MVRDGLLGESILRQRLFGPRGRSWRWPRFQALVLLIGGVGTVLLVSYHFLLKLEPDSQASRLRKLPSEQAQPSRRFCQRVQPPLVCAHGGDTTSAPPNTLQSFQTAINAEVDCVEVDVARTKDAELVVLHVRELRHLLGDESSSVQVGDLLWADISKLQWPHGEHVMRVEDAVRMMAPYVSCVTLDIKTYFDQAGIALDELEMADAVVKLVYRTGCTNCLVWAKSDTIVREVKRLSPGQRVGFVVMNETAEARRLQMDDPERIQHAEVVAAHHVMVDAGFSESIHGSGMQLFSWTVNEEAAMAKVLDAAVDGIVTNYPRMLQAAINTRMEWCLQQR